MIYKFQLTPHDKEIVSCSCNNLFSNKTILKTVENFRMEQNCHVSRKQAQNLINLNNNTIYCKKLATIINIVRQKTYENEYRLQQRDSRNLCTYEQIHRRKRKRNLRLYSEAVGIQQILVREFVTLRNSLNLWICFHFWATNRSLLFPICWSGLLNASQRFEILNKWANIP